MNKKVLIEIDEKFLKALPEEFYGKDEVSTGLVNEILIAVMHGVPYETVTEDAIDEIRTKIMDTGAYEQEVHGETEFLKGIKYCLGVLDKYMKESEEADTVTIKDIKDGGYFKRDDDIFIKPPYQNINHKDGGYYLGVNISTGQTLEFPHYTKVTPVSVKVVIE